MTTTPTPAPERSRGWTIVAVLLLLAFVGTAVHYSGLWERGLSWFASIVPQEPPAQPPVQNVEVKIDFEFSNPQFQAALKEMVGKEFNSRFTAEVEPQLSALQGEQTATDAEVKALSDRLAVAETKPDPKDFGPEVAALDGRVSTLETGQRELKDDMTTAGAGIKSLGEQFSSWKQSVEGQLSAFGAQLSVVTASTAELSKGLAANAAADAVEVTRVDGELATIRTELDAIPPAALPPPAAEAEIETEPLASPAGEVANQKECEMKYTGMALAACLMLVGNSVASASDVFRPAPVLGGGSTAEPNTCSAGMAPVTIDGVPHCQILDTAGTQCPPGAILVVGPGDKPACAKGNIVGAQQVNVGVQVKGQVQVRGASMVGAPHGGTPHCPAGKELVNNNGSPMCQGATHTICEPEFYEKLVPTNAINVVWDPNGCTFNYQLIN